jgi:hypothetical protein
VKEKAVRLEADPAVGGHEPPGTADEIVETGVEERFADPVEYQGLGVG